MNEEFKGLNLVELIDLLEDPAVPAKVSLAPQTAGWIVLVFVLAVLLFASVRWALRRWRANAYRRAALIVLDQAESDPAKIAELLRRTALAAYPRAKVANLTGDVWLAFLDQSFNGEGFQDGPGRVIAHAPYRSEPENPDLVHLARQWIRGHTKKSAM